MTPLSSLFHDWERRFTVVMWDQRCAGKTFVRSGGRTCDGLSLDQVAADGIQLTELLRRRLGQDRVIVLGHSWGAMVGLRMVRARPDLFSAYVGTGQVVSIPEKERRLYAQTLARLDAAGDLAGVRALQSVGAPPYRTAQGEETQRRLAERFDIPEERNLQAAMAPRALTAPGWSLEDLWQTFEQAGDRADAATFAAEADYDARRGGDDFRVPVYILNGEFDSITPTDLARAWFDEIRAPDKAFGVVAGGGHSVVLTRPDVFLQWLEAHVSRRVTVDPDRPDRRKSEHD